MSPAAIRRLLHSASALVLLFAHFGSADLLRYTLAAGAVIAVILDSIRVNRPALGAFVAKLVPVFRASESNKLSGATWLCIGYGFAAWFPLPAAMAGILAGAFADPAASLAGSMVVRQGEKKTWVGSGAAAVVAAFVLLPTGIPIFAVIAGAVAAMALERWPGPLNDNLTVAPGVALVVWILL